MSSFDSSQKMPHTVYFFFGSLDFVNAYVRTSNPDIQTQVVYFDTFSIEDARQLKMKLQEFTDENLVHIIRIEKMSFDTQNVLLKVCEELVHTVVAFSFPSSVVLLDTLRSRGFVVNQETSHMYFNKNVVELFLASSFSKRVSIVDTLIKEHIELDAKGVIRHLIEDLILLAQVHIQQAHNMRIFLEALKLLEFQKSSSKQIIEYISLMVRE